MLSSNSKDQSLVQALNRIAAVLEGVAPAILAAGSLNSAPPVCLDDVADRAVNLNLALEEARADNEY